MEAWRLMLALSGMLVVWVVLVSLLGVDPTAYDIVAALVFALAGIYIARLVTERFLSQEE